MTSRPTPPPDSATQAAVPPGSARRRLFAGLAVGAAAAGLGLAAQRWMEGRRPVSASPASDGLAPVADDWWALSFDTPDGSVLKLADLRGKPLVINFWATWCPPCVKELPDLERFWQAHRAQGWQVIGLAVDGPTPVRTFLAQQALSFPIGLAGLDGSALARRLGNEKGGLPFTLVVGADGHIQHRHLGASSYEDMLRWAKGA